MTITAIIPMLLKIFSIGLGTTVFYLVTDLSKEQKKTQAAEVLSQIVNFVLFIWLAKVLLNLPLLVSDPLAVLAYPSGSQAFYLAIFFSAAFLFYGLESRQIKGWPFIQTLLYILLPAIFFYEFAQLTWYADSYAMENLILYAVLLILFLLLNDRVTPYATGAVLLSMWTAGIFLIISIQSYSSIFGYGIAPWFVMTLFTAGHLLMLFSSRRRATNEFD